MKVEPPPTQAELGKAYALGRQAALADVAAGVEKTDAEIRAAAGEAYPRHELSLTWNDGYVVTRAAALNPNAAPRPRV